MIPTLVILGVVVVIAFAVIGIYNGLIRKRVAADGAWADIDVQLKRRYNLIPNLVETVKGYAAHERKVLERVIELRNKAASNTGSAASLARDENSLALELKRLFIVVEDYPTLKSDEHFLSLQRELALTEDRIAAARRFFNGNVREMNTLRQMFPTSLIGNVFGFEDGDFFELDHVAERVVPRVEI